tara:strand:- start:2114 stop:2536 length:423 start_codon:yes stop_codon:yes gene_type:complete
MSKAICLNIPGVNSSAAQWISWHKALKSCVGKKNANQLFVMQYDKVNFDANVELREYMRSQGVDLDRDVLDRAVDFGSGVYNWAGGVFEIGSGISIILVVMILGSVGFLLYNIGKDPDTAVRAGSAIATRGMSEVAVPKK